MSFESLILEEYGINCTMSEYDSDEELVGEKCIQLFASLLSSDTKPSFESTQKETTDEKEGNGRNSVNGEKSLAEKSPKLIVAKNSDFASGTDRISFGSTDLIGFHATEFVGDLDSDSPANFGINSEKEELETMSSAGDSQAILRRAPPPPAKAVFNNLQQQQHIHSSGIPSQVIPNSGGIGTGRQAPKRSCATSAAADPSATCRGASSSSSSSQTYAAQSPASDCAASSSSVVSETVRVRSVGQDRVAARPQVPPKPQIDLVRYSMANVKEELDLDTILGELLELENQLSSREGADQLLLGIPTLPTSSSQSSQLNQSVSTSNKVQSNGSLADEFAPPRLQTEFCTSPDADSAYGDSSSTECSSGGTTRYRNSEISSADSYRGSLNTPSPQQASPKSVSAVSVVAENQSACTSESTITTYNGSQQSSMPQKQLSEADLKAAKIREALEKMKEAKMKKIYVKFFLHDSSTQGLLIDERWTVLDTMNKLAEKLNINLTPDHAIVEEYPELHFTRIYEDHESVVENIEDWLADSKNKLYFIRRPDKYNFVHDPQHYLLTEKSDLEFPAPESDWNDEIKQELLKKFLSCESTQVPELEGWLMLKADGKKSWKKHYFVLRSSGLYYCPKGKMKSSKDLQCLMNVYNNQVYMCTDWKKKYKAPTEFGFAIKHPKIQVKASKYIKYVCTEDEKTLKKWVTALRIIRNSCKQLYKNYVAVAEAALKLSSSTPIKVEVPQVLHRHMDAMVTMGTPCRTPTNLDSPARASMLSRTTTSDRCSTPSTNIAFDQDECGTIKRQPGDLQEHGFIYQTQTPSTHSSMSAYAHQRYSNGRGSGTPTGTDECDSDEELFPPPPEVVGVLQRISMPQNNLAIYSEPSRTYRNHIPPSVPQKPNTLLSHNQAINTTYSNPLISPVNGHSQIVTSYQNNQLQVANNNIHKKTPPPPPKRSETTKLQNGGTPQSDLYSELQKATARQKLRIEGN